MRGGWLRRFAKRGKLVAAPAALLVWACPPALGSELREPLLNAGLVEHSETRHRAPEAVWRHAFNTMALATNRIDGIERWQQMLQRASAGCGEGCSAEWERWSGKVSQLQGLSAYAQLKAVNWLANQALRYRSDREQFGVDDYWASPAEALRGGGDCEDFVALKYLALREAGFPDTNLAVVVMRHAMTGKAHAVLAAHLEGSIVILDNRLDDLVSDAELAPYVPIYSFNAEQKWVHVQVRRRDNVALAEN
jgi:predicted transglutaminase-like cysteine proteinase